MLSELVLTTQLLVRQIVPIIVLFKNQHFLNLVLISFINIHVTLTVLLAIITMDFLFTKIIILVKAFAIIF